MSFMSAVMIFLNKWLRPGAGPSGMSGLPLHWVLYSTRVPTGPMYLDWALQVSLPGWAHSLEEGPNRYGVAWGHCLGNSMFAVA